MSLYDHEMLITPTNLAEAINAIPTSYEGVTQPPLPDGMRITSVIPHSGGSLFKRMGNRDVPFRNTPNGFLEVCVGYDGGEPIIVEYGLPVSTISIGWIDNSETSYVEDGGAKSAQHVGETNEEFRYRYLSPPRCSKRNCISASIFGGLSNRFNSWIKDRAINEDSIREYKQDLWPRGGGCGHQISGTTHTQCIYWRDGWTENLRDWNDRRDSSKQAHAQGLYQIHNLWEENTYGCHGNTTTRIRSRINPNWWMNHHLTSRPQDRTAPWNRPLPRCSTCGDRYSFISSKYITKDAYPEGSFPPQIIKEDIHYPTIPSFVPMYGNLKTQLQGSSNYFHNPIVVILTVDVSDHLWGKTYDLINPQYSALKSYINEDPDVVAIIERRSGEYVGDPLGQPRWGGPFNPLYQRWLNWFGSDIRIGNNFAPPPPRWDFTVSSDVWKND